MGREIFKVTFRIGAVSSSGSNCEVDIQNYESHICKLSGHSDGLILFLKHAVQKPFPSLLPHCEIKTYHFLKDHCSYYCSHQQHCLNMDFLSISRQELLASYVILYVFIIIIAICSNKSSSWKLFLAKRREEHGNSSKKELYKVILIFFVLSYGIFIP